MTIKRDFWAALVVVAAFASVGNAAIVSVTEVGLGSDTPAIISSGFGDGALAYSDRTHVHKDAQFDGSGTLSTTGSTTVPIPAYLDGNEYVRFANDARDNNPYVAVVEADEQVDWYLLIDNRLDGVAGTVTSSNTTDPVLGGVLAWVPLGNWQRVNTGISPNGQADYTSIDEDANGSLNQFFSIYKSAIPSNVAVVHNNRMGPSNMITLVAAPMVPEPSSALLGLFSVAGLMLARRRR